MARGRSGNRREETQATVLDASALITALADEPGRPQVEAILRRRPPPSISAVNLAEAIEKLVRAGGLDEEAVRDRIDWLIAGGLEVEPVWLFVARSAASIRARHYHRAAAPISHADAVCLATALALQTDLATTDPHLARLARAVGVEVIALPDSTGRRPEVDV